MIVPVSCQIHVSGITSPVNVSGNISFSVHVIVTVLGNVLPSFQNRWSVTVSGNVSSSVYVCGSMTVSGNVSVRRSGAVSRVVIKMSLPRCVYEMINTRVFFKDCFYNDRAQISTHFLFNIIFYRRWDRTGINEMRLIRSKIVGIMVVY